MSKSKLFFSSAFVFSVVYAGISIAAWTAPTVAPPGGNLAEPINVGTTEQTKSGNLTIGGGLIVGSLGTAGTGNSGLGLANGNLVIFDGNVVAKGLQIATGAGAGFLLVSDADGKATWASPSSLNLGSGNGTGGTGGTGGDSLVTGDYSDVTSSRTVNTEYTNGASARLVIVSFKADDNGNEDSVEVRMGASSATTAITTVSRQGSGFGSRSAPITFIVPPAYKYRFHVGASGGTVLKWVEKDLSALGLGDGDGTGIGGGGWTKIAETTDSFTGSTAFNVPTSCIDNWCELILARIESTGRFDGIDSSVFKQYSTNNQWGSGVTTSSLNGDTNSVTVLNNSGGCRVNDDESGIEILASKFTLVDGGSTKRCEVWLNGGSGGGTGGVGVGVGTDGGGGYISTRNSVTDPAAGQVIASLEASAGNHLVDLSYTGIIGDIAATSSGNPDYTITYTFSDSTTYSIKPDPAGSEGSIVYGSISGAFSDGRSSSGAVIPEVAILPSEIDGKKLTKLEMKGEKDGDTARGRVRIWTAMIVAREASLSGGGSGAAEGGVGGGAAIAQSVGGVSSQPQTLHHIGGYSAGSNLGSASWSSGVNSNIMTVGYSQEGPNSGSFSFLKSIDGGATWPSRYGAGQYGEDVTFTYIKHYNISDSIVYAAFTYDTDSRTTVLYFTKSTDGGLTWLPANSLIEVIRGRDIADLNDFYATGSTIYISSNVEDENGRDHKVYIHKSTNGGTSFSQVYNALLTIQPNYSNDPPLPVAGLSATNLYAQVYHGDVAGQTRLLYTSNGGSTWTTKNTTLPPLFSLAAIDANTLYALSAPYPDAGDESTLSFRKSTNGGTSWQTFDFPELIKRGETPNLITYNSNVLFVTYMPERGGSMKIARSTDAGATWSFKTVDPFGGPATLRPIDADNAYVVYSPELRGASPQGKELRFVKVSW